MTRKLLPWALALVALGSCSAPAPRGELRTGAWRAWLDSPGGELPFGLVLRRGAAGLEATLATGDYRYLAGVFADRRLRLSCFDGAHAFLFDARLGSDDRLHGDFWSRDSWHDTWVAERSPDAMLPDAFAQTRGVARTDLSELIYLDLDGVPRALSDPRFAGRARLVYVFGSWCPNCGDATSYLSELHGRYRGRGLSIVGLGFEMTGDVQRDAAQLRRYAAHHRIEFPLLVAGVSDKRQASAALPLVDRVRAYPTTIFLDRGGRVHAVHTGFSGPANGEAHRRLRRAFETRIETLLAQES